MPRKPKPTPYGIQVKLVDGLELDDPILSDHHTIEISGSYSYPGDGPYNLTETLAGYRWCASIFARLALRLADDVYTIRRNHGWCAGHSHCGITLDEASPAWRYAPTLTIDLPSDLAWEVVEQWRDRVNQILSDIIEADLWQPAPDDEAAWCS